MKKDAVVNSISMADVLESGVIDSDCDYLSGKNLFLMTRHKLYIFSCQSAKEASMWIQSFRHSRDILEKRRLYYLGSQFRNADKLTSYFHSLDLDGLF